MIACNRYEIKRTTDKEKPLVWSSSRVSNCCASTKHE